MTIPKKIHYCWLSGEPLQKDLQKCMQTWRDKMPDYEIVLWDKNKFDINSVDFVREACAAKKWASAADYIRAYALYTEGGIYLDSDVVVLKSFNDFLQYDFFTAVERFSSDDKKAHKVGIQAAVLGGIKDQPYLKDVLNWYETHHFSNSGYNLDFIAPDIYAEIAAKYGFVLENKLQHLKNNMLIFPSPVFAENLAYVTRDSYAVHYGQGSWYSKGIFLRLRRNNLMRLIFRKKPFQNLDDVIKGILLN